MSLWELLSHNAASLYFRKLSPRGRHVGRGPMEDRAKNNIQTGGGREWTSVTIWWGEVNLLLQSL